ncbi:MAG: hypothetical protein JST85_01440 [Acidobacteria bacterium]|nr:hypothetical protein [Acidobacteriota bacterium]
MKRTIVFSLAFTFFVAVGYFGMAIVNSQGKKDQDPDGVHQMDPSDSTNSQLRGGFALTTGGTSATTPISWHGGPVIATPTIYIIWYGNWNQSNGTDTPAGQQIVRDWANSIGGSPHFQLNQTYSISGTTITGNANFGGEYTDTGSQGTRLTDNKVKSVVTSAIGPGKLPYNANGVYFLLSSSNVSESSGFCSRYCGWHTYGSSTSGTIRYSFVGNAARCLSGCAAQSTSPNGNAGVDGMISVITHELEEATSDPNLNAWYDSSGAENADKCAWTFGHFQYQVANGSWANMHLGSRDYLIQRNLKHGTQDFCMVDSTHN